MRENNNLSWLESGMKGVCKGLILIAVFGTLLTWEQNKVIL
jgi:hypothetical protein